VLRTLSIAAVALLAGGFVTSGNRGDHQPAPDRTGTAGERTRRCEVGGGRSRLGITAGMRATVLGCAVTRHGVALELFATRDASGAGPCLRIAGLRGGTRGCGRAPSERVPPARAPIGGPATVRRSKGARIELYGETPSSVRRVVLRYRLPDKRSEQSSATLIRAIDKAALKRAGIRKPFGYFIGWVPPLATNISADARGAWGDVLGRLNFDPLVRAMHPTVFIAVRSRRTPDVSSRDPRH